MKTIPLSKGHEAIVDDEDYDELSKHKWHVLKKSGVHVMYACRTIKVDGKKKVAWMHRLINNTPEKLITDHINGDGLDNRRSNLRTVTHQDNMINCRRHKLGTSQYRGVSWHIGNKRWYSQITFNKKNIYIGSFATELEAKDAYDKKRNELRKNQIIHK